MSNENTGIQYDDILVNFDVTLRDHLRNDTSLYGLVHGRIHIDLPPAGEKTPLIILMQQKGGDLNVGRRQEAIIYYRIDVETTEDQALAKKIVGFIHSILNDKQLPLPKNWINYYTRGTDWRIFPFIRENKKIYRAGRTYEFRLNETSLPTLRITQNEYI